MKLPDNIDVDWLLAASGLLALWIGWVWKARPKWRHFWDRMNGGLDAITGREAFFDHATGKEVEPVLPMTSRMAKVEDAIVLLTEQQGQVTALQGQVAEVLALLAEHGNRLKSLEDGRLERVVTHMDSALAWKAFAQANGEDDTDLEPEPPELPAEEES